MNNDEFLKDKWFLINKDSFINLKEFIYFVFPAALLLIITWLAKQIITMEAGYLSIEELAA